MVSYGVVHGRRVLSNRVIGKESEWAGEESSLKLDLRPCVHKPPLSLLVVIAGVGFLMWLADVAITLQEKNDV